VTRNLRSLLFVSTAAALALGGAGLVYAQLEGADRGIPPIDSSSNLEVDGILVDVGGDNANEARLAGWRIAQRLGWKKLWARTTGRPENQAPNLNDSVLNDIISGIVVEEEQVGPQRYVARLGLLFDRARTGEMLGLSGEIRRSAPMLVIPVMRTGSTAYSLEFRNPWQNAWAQFRTAGSAVDYVRPVGNGPDPLLLNAAQTGRRSRGWWRALLDQYGAADIVIPEVQLRRLYPGGPAVARFTAKIGPDAQPIGSFELRAENAGQIPAMLADGVRRLDQLFIQAFNAGLLRPDPTLITPAAYMPPPPPQLPEGEIREEQSGLTEIPTQELPVTQGPSVPGNLPQPTQPTPTPAPTPAPAPTPVPPAPTPAPGPRGR
jgi:hypothetical protein